MVNKKKSCPMWTSFTSNLLFAVVFAAFLKFLILSSASFCSVLFAQQETYLLDRKCLGWITFGFFGAS